MANQVNPTWISFMESILDSESGVVISFKAIIKFVE
jgi:hypothetical protein